MVLALSALVALQGCGTSESKEGPPFQPSNIDNPSSLLITNSDIQAAGPTTPYGVLLRWFQALQTRNVNRVRRSYAKPISAAEARRQVNGFRPPYSQPIRPQVKVHGDTATIDTHVRTANQFDGKPNVIGVRDFHTHFYLVTTLTGWRLRTICYQAYAKGRQHSVLAVR